MTQLSNKRKKLLLIFLVASTLMVAALIISDWIPYIRGPAPETKEWYWPYEIRAIGRWWPPILVAGLMWTISAWWLAPDKTSHKRNILALSGLVLTLFLMQLALIYADRSNAALEL